MGNLDKSYDEINSQELHRKYQIALEEKKLLQDKIARADIEK